MPFIKPERRLLIEKRTLPGLYKDGEHIQPGDRCYVYYKKMVDRWKANPRWATAHEIYKDYMIEDIKNISYVEDLAAAELAWQVFFIKHVMPYEDQKEKENGTI